MLPPDNLRKLLDEIDKTQRQFRFIDRRTEDASSKLRRVDRMLTRLTTKAEALLKPKM